MLIVKYPLPISTNYIIISLTAAGPFIVFFTVLSYNHPSSPLTTDLHLLH